MLKDVALSLFSLANLHPYLFVASLHMLCLSPDGASLSGLFYLYFSSGAAWLYLPSRFQDR
jgi:hypothetical protein